jgi:hypothetical protein
MTLEDCGGLDKPVPGDVVRVRDARNAQQADRQSYARGTRNGRAAQTGPRGAAAGRRLAGAGAVLAVLAVAGCSSAGGTGTGTGAAAASPSAAAAPAGAASSLEQQYEQVVARVLPSVVQISTSSGSGSGGPRFPSWRPTLVPVIRALGSCLPAPPPAELT